MEGWKVQAMLHSEGLHCPSETLEPFWIHSSSPSFHGSSSMFSFENGCGESSYLRREEACDEDSNGFFLQPGKKRRLAADQVQFLEKYFGEENKLEPQRKAQLAKEVGLQPRQVAIWFQNRRARYKTKQLEKDYDSLKANYDNLQSEYDDVLKEKEKLKAEVLFLKDKLRVIDDDQELVPETGHETRYDVEPVMLLCKQEDASSAKSDVLDSNSPHYTEAAGSSDVFGSDFSQDEGGDSGPSLLKQHETHHAAASPCNFGLPAEDQFFCFWP